MDLIDAADRLGLAVQTLRHQARAKKLRAVRMGGRWYVSEDELERYRVEYQGKPGRKKVSPNT